MNTQVCFLPEQKAANCSASASCFFERKIYFCFGKAATARSGRGLTGSRQRGRRFNNPRLKRPVLRKRLSKNWGQTLGRCIFQSVEERFSPAFIQVIALAPASGYRTYTSGDLTNVGTGGYCWSSTPVSASNPIAGAMAFLSGLVYPLHSADCAYAFPVRCVQHLQAAFSRLK